MSDVQLLKEKISRREYTVGVVGLGYVGLPLVLRFGEVGFRVIGFDIDTAKVAQLNAGTSYIQHVPSARVQSLRDARRFEATAELGRLAEPDAVIICVPTPLTEHRDPDLRFVEKTADAVATALRRNQLVCLESTTYPGTTDEIVKPRLEARGFRVGEDVFLFLGDGSGIGSGLTVVGFSQGKFSVVDDADAGRAVSRNLSGITLRSPAGARRGTATRTPLEEFKNEIRGYLAGR